MSSDKYEKTRKKNPVEKLWLSFNDLQAMGVTTNWQSLRHWQQHHGFPTGRLFGPNSRRWSREEIGDWLASRPTARAVNPGPEFKSRRPRAANLTALESEVDQLIAEMAKDRTPLPRPPLRKSDKKRKEHKAQATAALPDDEGKKLLGWRR